MTVLKDYVSAVTERADEYKEAQDYYEGTVLEHFSVGNAQLKRVIRATRHRGQHNYCRVVVEAVVNRLEINNIVTANAAAQDAIHSVWRGNELDLEANEIHRRALEYGDCYALVWPDEEGELLISYNSPLTTALVYDPENPRKKLFAVKMWKTPSPYEVGKTHTRLNVYTTDNIQKFSAPSEEITAATNWSHVGSEENPFGEIPVFHFRTHRPYGLPEHAPAYGAQNDINKLLATHMYTVDYQGAPQRYALAYNGNEDIVDFNDDDTERENVGTLKSEPGNLWYLKGIMNVGQFQPADPKVFWEPIESLKRSMAALTQTPMHFFERALNVPSGEALRVAEAPLQKKVKDRQLSFGTTWKELFNFVLNVEGHPADDLEVKWELVESMDSLAEWDVMLKKINAGLSHRQALREAGYEEADIDRILAERDEEAAQGALYQRAPAARVSTDDNENFDNRNALTEQAKDNGGRGEDG